MGMEADINHYSLKLTLWSHRKAVDRKAIDIEDLTPVTTSKTIHQTV